MSSTPSRDVPGEDVPGEDVPGEDVPGEIGQRRIELACLRTLLMLASLTFAGLLLGIITPEVHGSENWPQWRGPNLNGSSETASPPVRWSSDENIQWRLPLPGQGNSTPIIWGDKLFLLAAIKTDKESRQPTAKNENPGIDFGTKPLANHLYQFAVLCIDRHHGRQIWQTNVAEAVPHEPGHLTNTYASSSPVTDGQRIYASFGSQGIYCLDMDGRILWDRDLGTMRTRRGYGEASSPALGHGIVVVPWDHEQQSSLVALDASTGKVKWRTDRDEPTTWATPLIVDQPDGPIVIMNGRVARAYDLCTGTLRWSCGNQSSNPIPTPIAAQGFVVCMTGYRGNVINAIPLQATGDITSTVQKRWSRSDAAPYVSSPCLYDGRLYFIKGRGNIVSSLQIETGEPVLQQQRLPASRTIYASPVAADGRIYFSSREGTTVVIAAEDELRVLAINDLGESIHASPACVDDVIYIRGQNHLYCIKNLE